MTNELILPVLSEAMIEDWRQTGHKLLASQVHLSQLPDVLGPGGVAKVELRVWRRGLPADVLQFTDAASQLRRLPPSSVEHSLVKFFNRRGEFSLSDGGLRQIPSVDSVASGAEIAVQPLTIERLTECLANTQIDLNLRRAFARYVVTALVAVLTHTKYAALKYDSNVGVYTPNADPQCHTDRVPTLLFHFSDPGTPYPMNLTTMTAVPQSWRTQAGDIHFHGAQTQHTFASKPAVNNQVARRLCLLFEASQR